MTKKEWVLSFQVAFTFIGTVVGAGFASGQEILKFFTRYTPLSSAGILVASILLGWLGSYLLTLGSKYKARSYMDVTHQLLGRDAARIIDFVMTFMLFGINVAMIAGVGALSQEQLGIPFDMGAMLTIAVTGCVLFLGIRGLLLANSLIVPFMMSVIGLIFLLHLRELPSLAQVESTGFLPTWDQLSQGSWRFIGSAVSYAAFNVGLSVVVLIPLGGEIGNQKVLKTGAWISAVFLCAMLFAIDWVMRLHLPDLLKFEIPMGELSKEIGGLFQTLFLLALWAEIFSTLLGNVFGLMRQVPVKFGPHQHNAELFAGFVILLVAFGASHIGFSEIVEHVYPAFGVLSLLLLLLLIVPSLVKRENRRW